MSIHHDDPLIILHLIFPCQFHQSSIFDRFQHLRSKRKLSIQTEYQTLEPSLDPPVADAYISLLQDTHSRHRNLAIQFRMHAQYKPAHRELRPMSRAPDAYNQIEPLLMLACPHTGCRRAHAKRSIMEFHLHPPMSTQGH